MRVAAELRRGGLTVATALERGSASKQLGWAAKAGLRAAVIVGEDEVHGAVVQVKHLRLKQQTAVPRSDLVHHLRGGLDHSLPI